MFDEHNDMMKKLLRKYIRDDLKFSIDKDDKGLNGDVDQASTSTDELSDFENLSRVICADDITNSSEKQKPTSKYEHTPLSKDVTPNSGASTLNENNNDAPIKLSIVETNSTLTYQKNHHQQIAMKKLVQVMNSISKPDNQLSKTMMSEISETKHEFCRHDVKGDGGSCLYRSVRYLLHFLQHASTKDLREITAYYIEKDINMRNFGHHSLKNCKNIDDYCSQVRGDLYSGEPELVAMAALFRKKIIVTLLDIDDSKSFGKRIEYGHNKLSECIYLLLYVKRKHFEPLDICNKQNQSESIKVFPCNDKTVEKLRDTFINNHLEIFKKKKNASNKRKKSDVNYSTSTLNQKRPRTDLVSNMFDPPVNQQQVEELPMALNNEHQEEKVEGEDEPNSKLENDAQDNDKFNYNSESSEAKPIS